MNSRILKFSDFVHFVEGEKGLTAIYNALTLGTIIVDNNIAIALKDLKDKIFSESVLHNLNKKKTERLISELKKQKLVFPIDEQVDLKDYLAVRQKLECSRIGILYLIMTDDCNLGCRYCFVEGSMPKDYKHSSMTKEIGIKGIDIFADSLKKSCGIEEPQIIFYGGEPFLNLKTLEACLQHIGNLKKKEELPRSTSITINTNGVLINETVVGILKNVENLNIAISLDGPRKYHDKCRTYHSNRGSYDDVVAGFNMLRKSGIGAGLCCTINKYNVNHLREIAEWFVEEFDVNSLGFNILIDNQQASFVMGNREKYAADAAREIIDCFRFFRESGVYEDRIMRKVNAFVDGNIYYNDCGGCGEQMVVAPSGEIGVCQGYCGTKKYFVKPGKDFDPLKHPYWKEWKYRSPLSMKQCRDCIALSICGGGCPYAAEFNKGSIWELDDIFCVHAQMTAEFLIKDLIKKASNKNN